MSATAQGLEELGYIAQESVALLLGIFYFHRAALGQLLHVLLFEDLSEHSVHASEHKETELFSAFQRIM